MYRIGFSNKNFGIAVSRGFVSQKDKEKLQNSTRERTIFPYMKQMNTKTRKGRKGAFLFLIGFQRISYVIWDYKGILMRCGTSWALLFENSVRNTYVVTPNYSPRAYIIPKRRNTNVCFCTYFLTIMKLTPEHGY